MEENKKPDIVVKNDKGKNSLIMVLLAIIVMLIIVLFLALNKKSTITNINNGSGSGNTGKEVVTPSEDPTADELVTSDKINATQQKAYDSIVNKTKYYGLYFKESTSIDNISDDKMMKFAISKYVLEKNINGFVPMNCFMDDNGNFTGKPTSGTTAAECKDGQTIAKSTIDSYIKDLFNTTKVFNSTGADLEISGGTEFYRLDNNKTTYYLGITPKSGGGYQIYRQVSKVEENSGKLYIYDRAMVCLDPDWGIAICQNGIDVEDTTDNVVFEKSTEDETKEFSPSKNKYNTDYIFSNYNNIYNYKHTFNKVNGNYYWVSSEVVK